MKAKLFTLTLLANSLGQNSVHSNEDYLFDSIYNHPWMAATIAGVTIGTGTTSLFIEPNGDALGTGVIIVGMASLSATGLTQSMIEDMIDENNVLFQHTLDRFHSEVVAQSEKERLSEFLASGKFLSSIIDETIIPERKKRITESSNRLLKVIESAETAETYSRNEQMIEELLGPLNNKKTRNFFKNMALIYSHWDR